MNIVIMGSGGAGGYFGAKFAKSGEDVTFVARGAHLDAMRASGLTIKSAVEGVWHVDAKAVETLDGHGIADLVLFCVKSFDTEKAAELLRPVVGPDTGIISVQNGVDNEEKLVRAFSAKNVLGGVGYVFSNIERPSVIAHHQFGKIVFGEFDASTSDRAEAYFRAFERASIPAELHPDIRRAVWQKFVYQTAQAGTTAVTRLPIKFLRDVPETRRLWLAQLEELMALAAAEGIAFEEDFLDRAIQFVDSLAPTNYSSLYLDLINGKRLELDAFHGHAVTLGARHAIPTPALFAVDAALRPYIDGTPEI